MQFLLLFVLCWIQVHVGLYSGDFFQTETFVIVAVVGN